ncbi:MAG: protein kinase, partial [Acidobacteriota bacterium]
TPQYMSPEQARGRTVDSRTDIFSFGIVLYEMVANKPPFSGENEFDTIGAILRDKPKPLKDYFPEVPDELEHLVSKALRKDTELRYQSIKELYIDLKDIRNTVETDLKIVHETNLDRPVKTLKTNNSIITEQRFSLIHLVVFLFIVLGTLGTIWWLTASPNIEQTQSQFKTEEIFNWTSKPGEFYSEGTFSPDAKMVAFVSTKSGSKGIWVKRTTSGEAVQITKDEVDYKNPVWSPNGDELAFYSSKGDKAGFWRIPTLGGTPKLIAAIDDGSSRLLFWSKTNQIYYESLGNIYAIDAVSDNTKQITNLNAVNGPSLSFSPDEKSIAYTKTEDNIWSFWTSDIKSETPKKLFSSENEIRNTVWHPDDKRLFFSQLVDKTFQIFVINSDGESQPQQITFSDQDAFVSDVSSDGSKILYGSAKEESDVWSVNLAESKESNVASEIDSELWADVTPDGKTIAYQSIKNLSQGNNLFYGKVLAKSLNTNEDPIELADSGFLPKWSPDGRTVAFVSISGDKYQIETIKPDGGEKRLLTSGIYPISYSILPYNRTQTSDFSWSSDSEKIIYISKRSGLSNIWIINTDGSNDTQLTENNDSNLNLSCPIWSANRKRIAFTSKTMNSNGAITYSVRVINIETKTTEVVNSGNSLIRLIGWATNDGELIFASVENDQTTALRTEVSLLRVNIETGELRHISKLKDTYQYNIHLSPDKKNIAFVAHNEDKDNIWIMPITGGNEKQVTNNNDSRLYFSSLVWSPDNNSIFFGKQRRYSLLSMLTDYK